MWRPRKDGPVDYRRMDYVYRQHHERYRRHVEAHGLMCQACGGAGGDYSYHETEPPELCGWCETTGKVTRWLRGLWLRTMRDEKRKKAEQQQAARASRRKVA